jgi:hypothetical protein
VIVVDQLSFQVVDQPFVHPEFIVNGVPLAERLGAPPRHPSGRGTRLNQIPPIVFPLGSEDALSRLLLDAPPDLRDGRNSILVCEACGDIECGVISAVIVRDGGTIVWRDFASQSPDSTDLDRGWYIAFTNVPPMRFDERAYRATLLAMIQSAVDAV